MNRLLIVLAGAVALGLFAFGSPLLAGASASAQRACCGACPCGDACCCDDGCCSGACNGCGDCCGGCCLAGACCTK